MTEFPPRVPSLEQQILDLQKRVKDLEKRVEEIESLKKRLEAWASGTQQVVVKKRSEL